MAGPEAIKEVQEGHARLVGGQVGDERHVLRLLHAIGAQHGPAGLADGHHILVVAEDAEGVAGDGTGCHMQHAGDQLASNLVPDQYKRRVRGARCGQIKQTRYETWCAHHAVLHSAGLTRAFFQSLV